MSGFTSAVVIKRSLHGQSAVPLVCVQCSRHTHLAHSAQRTLSERMHACHCCVLLLSALLFSHSFDNSFCFLKICILCAARKDRKQAFTAWRRSFLIITSLHLQLNDTEVCACEQNTEQQCHSLRSRSAFGTQK